MPIPDNEAREQHWVIVILIGLALLCCASLCGLALLDRVRPSHTTYLWHGTRVCAGVASSPYDWQVGLAWEVPRHTLVLSSLGPPLLHSSTALCVSVPLEIPFLPMRGALAWPP